MLSASGCGSTAPGSDSTVVPFSPASTPSKPSTSGWYSPSAAGAFRKAAQDQDLEANTGSGFGEKRSKRPEDLV